MRNMLNMSYADRKTFSLQIQQGRKPIDERRILIEVQALQQRIKASNKEKYGGGACGAVTQ